MLLWIPAALAVDVPDFVPGQHVYTVTPSGTPFLTPRTDAATGATHEPINVVVYETVIRPGSPTRSSFTEDALEDTLSAWRADPDYRADKDSLVVLALDDREVRLVAGSTWDAELRLHNDTLLPLIDEAFMPVAVTGDLDGGVAALVARFDKEIEVRKVRKDAGQVPKFDAARRLYVVPEGLAAPAATEAAVKDASPPVYVVFYKQAIGLDGGSMSDVTQRTFDAFTQAGLPADAAVLVVAADLGKWETRVGPARLERLERSAYQPYGAVGTDVDSAAAQAVGRLASDLLEADTARATYERNVLTAEIGVPSLIFLVGLGAAGALGRAARSRFHAARDGWQETLAKGRENIDDFRADTVLRDKIVELRLRGPVTLALVNEVTAHVDEIEVGVRALESRLAACEAAAGGSLLPGKWDRATAMLAEPFEFDTGKAQQRLFAGPTKVITVAPDEFLASLDEKYLSARSGWEHLLEAVEASLRRAQDDFPTDDLQKMRASLAEAGLPEAWVGTHPLLADPEAAWAALDELRKADPVDYLQELSEAIALDDQLEADVGTVVEAVLAARAARAKAEAISLDGVTTTLTASPRNPTDALEGARKCDELLAREIADDPHTDELVECANQSEAAWEKVASCRAAVLDAVAHAAERVTEAGSRVEALDRDVATAVTRLGAMLAEHSSASVADAWAEVKQAQQDVSEAKVALADAQRLLAEGAHLGADDAAALVRDEHGQGAKNLAELVAILDAVVWAQKEAQRGLAELQTRRATLLAELGSYGGEATSFGTGDQLLATLNAEGDGPTNWRARAREVASVNTAWTTAVTTARAEHERREAARRAAEAAAAAAAARARAAASRSSSYRSSSSSSRSSSWGSSSRSSSSRSSSSSSRSSGSSYSSSSRSSGRSFSSGGRSAGRKF